MVTLREREGMLVYRDGNTVVKQASDDENHRGLVQASRFLHKLADTPFVPKLLGLTSTRLVMEYIEETPITDTEQARRYATQALLTFRKRGIIHGDATSVNVVWRNNIPVFVDFDQSNFAISEARPQKRPKPDIEHLMPVLIEKVGDPSRVVRRYQALRDHMAYYHEWGTFADLGCHALDMGALAAVDGMTVTGVDNCQIHSDSLDQAWNLWGHYFSPMLWKQSIVNYVNEAMKHTNVAALFSTWPYIYADYGPSTALNILKKLIDKTDILFVEIQLFGDGPGPRFLKTEDDTYNLLRDAGGNRIEKVVTIPVGGRDAERTIWKAY